MIQSLRDALHDRYMQIFVSSLLTLAALYVVPNNKLLLVLAVAYVSVSALIVHNFAAALIQSCILFLPFEKGKTLSFLLLPARTVYPPVDFSVSATFTISVFMIAGLVFLYLRGRLFGGLRRTFWRPDAADALALAFVYSCFFSAVISPAPELSLLLTLIVSAFACFFFFIRRRIRSDPHLIGSIGMIFAAQTVFEAGWTLLQVFNGGPLGKAMEGMTAPFARTDWVSLASEDPSFLRVSGTYSDPNFLGLVSAVMIPVFLYQTARRSLPDNQRVVAGVALASAAVSLVLSASRASWIAAAVISYAVLRYLYSMHAIHIIPAVKRIFIGLVVVCLVLLPTLLIPRLSQFSVTANAGGGIDYRLTLLEKSVSVGWRNPAGVGLGAFPLVLFRDAGGFTSYPTQPHNLPAQVFVASGWLGIISFLLFVYTILRKTSRGFRAERHTVLRHGFVAGTVTFLIAAQFYPVLTEQTVMGYFWVMTAIVAPALRPDKV